MFIYQIEKKAQIIKINAIQGLCLHMTHLVMQYSCKIIDNKQINTFGELDLIYTTVTYPIS